MRRSTHLERTETALLLRSKTVAPPGPRHGFSGLVGQSQSNPCWAPEEAARTAVHIGSLCNRSAKLSTARRTTSVRAFCQRVSNLSVDLHDGHRDFTRLERGHPSRGRRVFCQTVRTDRGCPWIRKYDSQLSRIRFRHLESPLGTGQRGRPAGSWGWKPAPKCSAVFPKSSVPTVDGDCLHL